MINLNTKRLLVEAKALISDEKHWTKGWFAVDAEGVNVSSYSKDACGFCMVGALTRSQRYLFGERSEEAVFVQANNLLKECSNAYTVASFNDSPETTHAMVMEVFDKAIKSL